MFRRHVIFLLLLATTIGASLPVAAQESEDDRPKPSWKKEFDVKVERVDPTDLPEPEESRFPTVLQSDAVLPKPTNLSTLKETASTISPWVVEVIAVTRSATGLKSTPVVLRGHAVWVSAKTSGQDPVLLTTYNWLEDVDAVFVHPAEKRLEGKLPKARRKSIDELRADADAVALLRSGRLVPVELSDPDEHRNLTRLTPRRDDTLEADRGFALFPIEGQSPTRVYGYSPQMNSALVETQFVQPKTRKKELLFYLQSTYPGILGAPLVSSDGRLIGITATRHPYEQDRSLVIPPGALRAYLSKVQGIESAADDDE
jgi:hypothetical protein